MMDLTHDSHVGGGATASGPCFRINEPDVIHQMFDREVVVVDLRTGSYYSLSEVAGRAWLEFGPGGQAVGEVARVLAATFEISPEAIVRDLEPFLDELVRLELIAPCSPSVRHPGTAASDPVPEGTMYAPPSLTRYNDLQDLFLLDPVHEVDAAAGWPHPAPNGTITPSAGTEGPEPILRAAASGDLLQASLEGTTILVNRDLGFYCTLDQAGTELWQALQAGPVVVTDAAAREALEAAGLVESVAAPTQTDGINRFPGAGNGARVTVHRELEQLMRPWIRTARPVRRSITAHARQLLDRLDRCFEDTAADAAGTEDRTFRIGEATLQVASITAQDCQRVHAALAHLQTALPHGHPPDLRIRMWNLTATPRAPLLADLLQRLRDNWEMVCGPRGEVLELHGTEVSAIYNAGPDVLSVVDLSRNTGWFLKLDDRPLPYWEIGSPFRFMLHRWFASRGLQYVHAAAVGDHRGGVLLVGAGGSGKSTTSMLCAASGMLFAGDDYCLADPGRPWVHSLYGSGKLLGQEDLERFPALRGLATNPDGFELGGDGKAVVTLSQVWTDRMVSGMPIKAIAVPRVTGQPETWLEPCTSSEALVALLPSTVGQLPEADGSDCERLVALVSGLPAFTLYLGTETTGIPRTVGTLLG